MQETQRIETHSSGRRLPRSWTGCLSLSCLPASSCLFLLVCYLHLESDSTLHLNIMSHYLLVFNQTGDLSWGELTGKRSLYLERKLVNNIEGWTRNLRYGNWDCDLYTLRSSTVNSGTSSWQIKQKMTQKRGWLNKLQLCHNYFRNSQITQGAKTNIRIFYSPKRKTENAEAGFTPSPIRFLLMLLSADQS